MTCKLRRTTLRRLWMIVCLLAAVCAAQSDHIPDEVRRQIPAHPPVGVSFYKIDARVAGTGQPLGGQYGITRWIAGRGFQIAFEFGDRTADWNSREKPYCSTDGGRTWSLLTSGLVFHESSIIEERFAISGDKLYVLSDDNPPLAYSEACGPWVRDSSPGDPKAPPAYDLLLGSSNGSLWATAGQKVWRIDAQVHPAIWNFQLGGVNPVSDMVHIPMEVTQFGEKTCVLGIPVWCFDGTRWDSLPAIHNPTARIAGFKRHLLMWDSSRLARYSDTSGRWENIATPDGSLMAAWESDGDGAVIVVATTVGVFWSNDGGKTFQNAPQPKDGIGQVYQISSFDSGLMISTTTGLYYAVVNIPPHGVFALTEKWVGEHLWESATALVIVLLFGFASSRMLLIVLSWKIKPIPEIADIFFETRFGRWRLYRAYRKKLAAELKDTAAHFVEIPFEVVQPAAYDPAKQRLLSAFVGEQPGSRSVLAISQAGRGKTALCEKTAYTAAEAKGGRVPVIIRGTSFNGDIVKAVTAELRFRGAWASEEIVKRQIEGKKLLLIFDGVSEINPDSLSGMAEQLRSLGQQTCLVTSRYELPEMLEAVLRPAARIGLFDIDAETEVSFFAVYMQAEDEAKRLEKAKRLKEEVARTFPALPRTPLFMKVVASVFNESGQVPTSLGLLFERYVADLIARAKTRSADPDGLLFAIRELTSKTFVERWGTRRGFTEERGIEILSKAGDDLKARNVTVSALEVLNLLTRAGMYARNRHYYTAAHDLLEDYFAALVLEREWDNDNREKVEACGSVPSFAEAWRFLREIRPEVDSQGVRK